MKQLFLPLIGLVFLSSCSYGFNLGNSSVQDNLPPKKIEVFQNKIDTASSKIKESPEFVECMNQQVNMCIQNTGMQIAQRAKDTTFCNELGSNEQRSSCIFAITMIAATEKDDITLCNSLTEQNYQKQCKLSLYKQQAMTKKDLKLCDQLSTLEEKGTGSGIINPITMDIDNCKMQIIMSSMESTENDCEGLSDTGSTTMCKSIIKNRPPAPKVGIETKK